MSGLCGEARSAQPARRSIAGRVGIEHATVRTERGAPDCPRACPLGVPPVAGNGEWRIGDGTVTIARRTMRTVRINLGFTAACNPIGLSLAALGLLPPIAAAAQSLPDLGILANSSRLLRQR